MSKECIFTSEYIANRKQDPAIRIQKDSETYQGSWFSVPNTLANGRAKSVVGEDGIKQIDLQEASLQVLVMNISTMLEQSANNGVIKHWSAHLMIDTLEQWLGISLTRPEVIEAVECLSNYSVNSIIAKAAESVIGLGDIVVKFTDELEYTALSAVRETVVRNGEKTDTTRVDSIRWETLYEGFCRDAIKAKVPEDILLALVAGSTPSGDGTVDEDE